MGYPEQEVAANRSRQNKSGSSNKNRKAVENATMKKGQDKKIGEGNKGYELIVKMGYQAGQGLGKDGKGVLEPLPLERKTDRKGLGASKQEVQTCSSKKRRNQNKKAKARQEVELQARLARDQANIAQKAANTARKLATKAKKTVDKLKVETTKTTESKPKLSQHSPVSQHAATKARNLATKAQKAVDNLKVETTTATESKPKPRQHSPVSQHAATKARNLATKAQMAVDKLKVETTTATESKPKPRQHSPVRQTAATDARNLANTAQKAVDKLKVETTTATESKPKPRQHLPVMLLTPQVPVAKEESDSKYLKDLLNRFHSEIELMQLRLETTKSGNPECDDNDLIVAKIRVGNDETITERAFDLVRTELVGWIGMYQGQDMETPIFHAMTNNHSHITVVCDNNYAFQCLEHCIEDITKIKSVNGIYFFRLPRITPVVYCFEAAYEGVARDADLFLRQIHLHKPKLLTDYWIVVSHEVCTQEHKTYMSLLIDERSALALDFQYSRKICICLQMVIFRYRGIVTDKNLY